MPPLTEDDIDRLSPAEQDELGRIFDLDKTERQEARRWTVMAADPLAFVREAFPWGAGALAQHAGPDEWQADILAQVRDGLPLGSAIQIAVASGHGVGKAQRLDDVVPTPAGERKWGDLRVGDEVFGRDGAPTSIMATRHYRDVPMFRVTFDDGASLDVSSGHLWTVRGRQERRRRLPTWRTVETIDIMRMGVKRSNGVAQARQWEVPVQFPAQFPARALPLHPYFVGVWLGDGSQGIPQWTKPVPEIAERVRQCGYEVSAQANGQTYRVLGITGRLTDPVFSLPSHERYIPEDYKFTSVGDRMAVFAGLCDSDGEAHASGSIGYATTSRRLAEDVVWLARSLGGKAAIQSTVKRGWYPDGNGGRVECRDCWRVTINVPFNPFTHPEKKAAYKPSEARYLTRWIDSIEPIGTMDAMCITVAAADGLYQAVDFLVTHNSALVSWLVLWAVVTARDTKGVVTANTESQLRTKTWPELAKWHRLCAFAKDFTLTATSLYSADAAHEKTWRVDAIPWSERNTEAFAGLHNQGRRILVLFDEASAIPDVIWETTEGALTDEGTQILWAAFGNPTRNTGRFRECFGRFRHRWTTRQIDSRTARMTNKAQIAQWVADYGEDSDFVRVRVRGIFPRSGSTQLIPQDVVDEAMAREPHSGYADPLVMGVDVARFGADQSVICLRHGRNAKFPMEKHRGMDTMQLAARVAVLIDKHRPDAVFVDETGVGGGVVDRLRQLGHRIMAVNFGAKASGRVDGELVANKRAEMWCRLREWLKTGGAISNDADLLADLPAVEYGYTVHNEIQLEKKDDMRKRGLASPDCGDALALTFAHPVVAKGDGQVRRRSAHQADWDPTKNGW